MIFDVTIDTKTVPNGAKDSPKEMLFSSSIYAPIWNSFWHRFGSILAPFWTSKIIKKAIPIFFENQVAAT